MWKAERGRTKGTGAFVRVVLLTALAFCCTLPAAWALSGPESAGTIPDLGLPDTPGGLALPQCYDPAQAKDNPLLGALHLTLGRAQKLTVKAFTYGGRTSLTGLSVRPTFALSRTSGVVEDGSGRPVILPRTGLEAMRARDDQAQSFAAQFDAGRGKLSFSLQNVGAKFSDAANSLSGVDQSDLQALVKAAGTQAFDLSGSYQLLPGASFSSTRTALSNDKPGDDKRGLTTTDWANALSLTLGKSTSMRLALTDHSEEWDPTTGKSGLARRTTEFGGESKFGQGGKYSLRFGLTDVSTTTGGREQSDKTRELHLALPLHSHLRLNADYTARDGTNGAQTTNLVGAVLQLYPGAELTANLKTLSVGGKDTQERFLKFTGDLGHGGSSANLQAEQTSTRTPDAGMVENTNLGLKGVLGKGGGTINVRAAFQEKRGDNPSAALERLATFHLERAFGPRFILNADREEKARGTVGRFDTETKSVCALTAALTPRTKLTAGVSLLDNSAAPSTAWNRDLVLEHRLAGLQLRAEEHRCDRGPDQKNEIGFGVDWPQGKLPEWAAGLSRRHEFGDAYEYQVKREANWLELPFSGTRFWAEQRRGGDDDGARTWLVSHRTVLAKRYHLQLTYHDRPDYEEGDKKGRPQPLRREYAELGVPFAHGLIGRTWFQAEQHVTDPLSQRQTVGLALLGKLHSQAQVELDYAQDSGSWEGRVVDRNAVALLYSKRLDDTRNLSLKLGYAWGENVTDARNRDGRLTLAYTNGL